MRISRKRNKCHAFRSSVSLFYCIGNCALHRVKPTRIVKRFLEGKRKICNAVGVEKCAYIILIEEKTIF